MAVLGFTLPPDSGEKLGLCKYYWSQSKSKSRQSHSKSKLSPSQFIAKSKLELDLEVLYSHLQIQPHTWSIEWFSKSSKVILKDCDKIESNWSNKKIRVTFIKEKNSFGQKSEMFSRWVYSKSFCSIILRIVVLIVLLSPQVTRSIHCLLNPNYDWRREE